MLRKLVFVHTVRGTARASLCALDRKGNDDQAESSRGDRSSYGYTHG